jgi:cardiolipin synthase
VEYNKAFAQLLEEDFLRDANVSTMLSYHEYLVWTWGDKLKEGFGKVFSPLL